MITVAIDGYSSTGKSTMARRLAARVGYRYIDTGAMYRAVTLFALRNSLIDADGNIDIHGLIEQLPKINIGFTVADNGQLTTLDGENVEQEIRSMEVSGYVSQIAAIPSVRSELVERQRAMGLNGGVVMDGRDIGTTVFPHAELKLFVTASPEVRAQRRFAELEAKGQQVTMDEVLENVKHRDYLDEHRDVSPLHRAEDAVLIDNTHLTPSEQDELVLNLFEQALRHKDK